MCLQSDECQVDWLGPRISTNDGNYLANNCSAQLIVAKLRENSFLGYAALYRAYHVLLCENRGEGDIFDLTVEYLRDYTAGVTFIQQLRQYLINPNRRYYWPPARVFDEVVSSESLTVFERYLDRFTVDLNERDQTGSSSLLAASDIGLRDGDPEQSAGIVRRLLDLGANPCTVDNNGQSALHLAAARGHIPNMENLIDRGCSLALQDGMGDTPLCLAAGNGHTHAVEVLIAAGADIETRKHAGHSPLHLAASYGYKDTFQVLLGSHAAVECLDNNNRTPLHLASHNSYYQIVEILLEHGVSVNALDNHGQTALHLATIQPLHIAALNGHVSIISTLIHHGVSLDPKKFDELSPIAVAIAEGQFEAVKRLLEAGASTSFQWNGYRSTALHWAARHASTDWIRLLLATGLPVDMDELGKETPLFYAAAHGCVSVVKLLFDSGVDLNHLSHLTYIGHAGGTPLHWAAKRGHADDVKALIDAGANNDLRIEPPKATLLHLAAGNGHLRCCELLIEFGAAVEPIDVVEESPLWRALKPNHLHVCQFLLKHGSKFFTNLRSSLLHEACWRGHVDIARSLLDTGMHVDRLNEDGRSPLQLVIAAGKDEV